MDKREAYLKQREEKVMMIIIISYLNEKIVSYNEYRARARVVCVL